MAEIVLLDGKAAGTVVRQLRQRSDPGGDRGGSWAEGMIWAPCSRADGVAVLLAGPTGRAGALRFDDATLHKVTDAAVRHTGDEAAPVPPRPRLGRGVCVVRGCAGGAWPGVPSHPGAGGNAYRSGVPHLRHCGSLFICTSPRRARKGSIRVSGTAVIRTR
ncbi:hypothetical protein GCM10012275_20250 [Longimycelium tulufanense]|uniref:Uncharacterized protein n=1 Tax=Longimycelium tulufanense TaxID=907463 RepID=A0A8J3CA79_9PSEU|nr:hypothetical protein GCM10012275_20250 [Longimycelium tulufanense]